MSFLPNVHRPLLSRQRVRPAAQAGFTLIELLVVVIIIGVLAGIGLALLLNQRGKGADAEAKSMARAAASAMETCAIDTGGVYNRGGSPCDKSELIRVEPSLNDLGSRLQDPVLGNSTYRVTVASERAPAEVSFAIRKLSDGSFERICTVGSQDKGGCLAPGAPGDDW